MKLLILAAGYATRLHPLTLYQAKSLLTIAGRPIVEHLLDKFRSVRDLDTVYIVTNAKFDIPFRQWVTSYQKTHLHPQIKIINDGTRSEADRLGAIGDLHFVLNHEEIHDDLAVVAGDNLFTQSVGGFLAAARKNARGSRVTIATYDVVDLKQVRQKYNSIQTDAKGRVTSFIEKDPQATSTVTAICLYYFPRATLPLVRQYLNECKGNADQPGHYLQWLYRQKPAALKNFGVYTYRMSGLWWDIGSRETYEEAERRLTNQEKKRKRKPTLPA